MPRFPALVATCVLLEAAWQLVEPAAVSIPVSPPQPSPPDSQWLLHDPGFPVVVHVAPFGDAAWASTASEANSSPLRVPSTLLNLTVELPRIRNLSDVRVSISLFQPIGNGDEFKLLADTQVAHAVSYRLDMRHVSGSVVLRAYVEGSRGQLPGADAGADVKARAFFVRPIDLAPSEAEYHLCGGDGMDGGAEHDAGEQLHAFPPVNMPRSMCRQFTMDGRVPVRKWYFDDQTNADQSYAARSREYIETLIAKARAREQFYYGATDTFLYEALRKYPVAGQHVLIIGSTTPWYESVCIAHGAASCTTIDYNQLHYEHPQITTVTLAEFAATSGSHRRHFDAILSISSFEHDGLGRYGDPLSPDADLVAMKTALQYATPGGATKLFLAVPVGPDCLVWNAQRIYGSLRLPLLVAPWTLVDSFGFQKSDFTAPFTIGHQPVFVLEPPTSAPSSHTSFSPSAASDGEGDDRSEL